MRTMSVRATMAAACLVFFALGLVTAGLGPALPELAVTTGSDLATLGAVFTAIFFGALLAQLVAGPLNDRLGQRPVLLGGLVLLALGMLGVASSRSLPLALACAAVAGLGHGAVDVSANLLVAEVFAGRSAAALNLANVFFGVGAVAGPALAGLTLGRWGTALPALWCGAGALLLAAPLVPYLATAPLPPAVGRAAAPTIMHAPLLWLLGLMILIYVGIENGMGGWTSAYLARTTALGADTAALVTAGFWLALTFGRLAATLIGGRVPPELLLMGSLAGALLGGGLLVASTGSVAGTVAAVLVLGLCFGPIFPTGLSVATATFRSAPGTAASVIVAMGSVGGMLLPWLQGMLLERSGPRASVALVAAGTLAMLALYAGWAAWSVRRAAARRAVA